MPFLEIIKPKLKIFNAYIWTSKQLLDVYIRWAKENKFNWDILIYAKNNPVPAYNNSYLSDIEYCLFIRDKGATFNNGLGYKKYKKVIVLDCFIGSGTTAVACQDLNRNYIGFEIEEKYYNICKNRLAESKYKVTKWFK